MVRVFCTSQIALELVQGRRPAAGLTSVYFECRSIYLAHVFIAALAMAIEPPSEDPLKVVGKGLGKDLLTCYRSLCFLDCFSQLLTSMHPPRRTTTGIRQ